MVYRVYVEKKPGLGLEAAELLSDIRENLGITSLTGLRLMNRYDVEGIDRQLFNQCRSTVFSEPLLDNTYDQPDFGDDTVFAVEYLPGQFDQRADSASQCVQIISQGERPLVRTAKVYALKGSVSPEELERINK